MSLYLVEPSRQENVICFVKFLFFNFFFMFLYNRLSIGCKTFLHKANVPVLNRIISYVAQEDLSDGTYANEYATRYSR